VTDPCEFIPQPNFHPVAHLTEVPEVVSSWLLTQIFPPRLAVLDEHLRAGSGNPGFDTYAESKFVQLLGAHWWRRQLAGQCVVVATSPGLIPGTGLSRGWASEGTPALNVNMTDAKSIPEGEFHIFLLLPLGQG
jgi:hypothetical protein